MSAESVGYPVVILSGGRGVRFREQTETKPKPMIEVCGRPILWHIMSFYAGHGFREFVLCLGYKASVIKRYFLDYASIHSDFTVDDWQRSQQHNTETQHAPGDKPGVVVGGVAKTTAAVLEQRVLATASRA